MKVAFKIQGRDVVDIYRVRKLREIVIEKFTRCYFIQISVFDMNEKL